MKRTNTDGHIANKYTDGIPGSVAATIVGAEEMNNIQEEIALTVEASGQTVDQTGATDDQLIDAIKILAERNRTVSGDDVVGTRTGLSPLDKVSFLPTVRSFLENKILTASDAANTDWFGLTISIYGDTIVVGAGLEDGAGSDRGAAYVYTRSGTTWTEEQKLTASDAANIDRFGGSVSIYGDTIVVGAGNEDGAGSDRGAAYVYTRSGTTWTEEQKLTASDAADSDLFGGSVSIYGDTIVVGANSEDGAGSDRGAAYVYTRSGTTWTEEQILTASDAADSDQFGKVSIYGDTIVVGASTEDGAGSDRGAAYVYTRSGTTWTEEQKLTASDAADSDLFGGSVSIYGDTIVVGANSEDGAGSNRGAAYVYTRSGTTWTEEQILTASDAADSDQFGHSVSIYNNHLVVGANLEDGAGSDRGAAYVFRGAANEFLLPPSPTIGDKIEVWDGNGDFGEYTLDIDPNGKKIRGSTDTLSFITQNEVVDLVYVSEDQGWNYRKETKDNPIITKINPFTMDVQTSTTAPTLHATAVERSSWYRVGNMMHISFKLVQDLGSGTAGTGTYRFMIPNSKTIDQDYAIISTVNTMNFGCSVGHASAYDDNLGYFSHGFVYVAGTNYLHMYLKRSATGFSDVSSTTFDFGVENYMSFNAVVPIAEWA